MNSSRPIIDSHLDLAWNALYFNRDLLRPVADVRAREAGMTDELARARNTLTLPELRRAKVAICFATLMARSGPGSPKRFGLKRTELDYETQSIAYGHAMGQLAYYRLLESQKHLTFIINRAELKSHWEKWTAAPDTTPLGIILSMEGADAVLFPDHIDYWWEQGLRAVGPVHYGRSVYAHGTGTEGPLGPLGVEFIKKLNERGMILDVTHFADISFTEALEISTGPVIASHHNCRALVPGQRQLEDSHLIALIQRNAIIGTAFDNWMLFPDWKRGESNPKSVSIAMAADHIDHICQLAGTSRHCALGTDLDGGFGTEQTPFDLDTYSDLHQLEAILDTRGYKAAEIDGIFFGNWLSFLAQHLP